MRALMLVGLGNVAAVKNSLKLSLVSVGSVARRDQRVAKVFYLFNLFDWLV